MAVYKFRFLGSVTECKTERDGKGRVKYTDNEESEPFVLEVKVFASTKEKAQYKICRMIAWDVERRLRDMHE